MSQHVWKSKTFKVLERMAPHILKIDFRWVRHNGCFSIYHGSFMASSWARFALADLLGEVADHFHPACRVEDLLDLIGLVLGCIRVRPRWCSARCSTAFWVFSVHMLEITIAIFVKCALFAIFTTYLTIIPWKKVKILGTHLEY